jgi:hypothetical protein
MSEVESVKYFSSYTPAQKKASQLYRLKNKEKINEQRKKYYQTKKLNDPKFLEYKRIKAKEYYEKKKLDKVVKPEALPEESKIEVPEPMIVIEMEKPVPDIVKEVELAPLPEDIVMKPMDVPTEEPNKKKRKSKSKK